MILNTNGWGQRGDPLSVRYLESDRQSIYAAACPEEMKDVECVLSAEYVAEKEFEGIAENELYERVVAVKGDKIWELQAEEPTDKYIIRIADCYEYTFSDDPDVDNSDQWILAFYVENPNYNGYGEDILQMDREEQFKEWKDGIENPEDMMSLREDVRIANKYGIDINICDWQIFPSPEEDKADRTEHDENGKVMVIGRQVSGIRKWNVKNRCYEAVDAHLIGAPTAEEAPKYWEEMLEKLREKYGAETVNGWVFDEK